MEKIQKNKKVLIIIGFAVLLVILVGILVKCGSEEKDVKEPGKEVHVKEQTEEDGLGVGEAQDADKETSENAAEFVESSADTDKNNDTEAPKGIDVDESADDAGDTGNGEPSNGLGDTDNLDTEKTDDGNGQYGGFF